jgi:hypothetical protein
MLARSKSVRALVSVLILLGIVTFIVDFLNPATPTPLVFPRVAVLAQLVFAIIRVLAYCFVAVAIVVWTDRVAAEAGSESFAGLRDVQALTCVRLN